MPTKPTKLKSVKSKETKAQLFVRLGTQRIEKVLKSIRILGNCSNKGTYEYTPEQITKMSEKLTQALELMLIKFQNTKKEQEKFKF